MSYNENCTYVTYFCRQCTSPTNLVEVPTYRVSKAPFEIEAICSVCGDTKSVRVKAFDNPDKARQFLRKRHSKVTEAIKSLGAYHV